jgi:hypothetical protein
MAQRRAILNKKKAAMNIHKITRALATIASGKFPADRTRDLEQALGMSLSEAGIT